MFEKILLAATPQAHAQAAARAAFGLARDNGSELLLFHGLPIGTNDWCSFAEIVPDETLIQACQAKIRDFYAAELATIHSHSILIETGRTADKLLKAVHREGVDLVVMGHHTGTIECPGRMWGLVDTSIRAVCANASCPVLVVTDEKPEPSKIERILLAMDFSTPSESTLCYAATLAKAAEAHIDVFHVLDTGRNCPDPKYYMQPMDDFIDQALERMKRRYAGALKGVSHAFECWEGTPYIEILKRARWSGADLVIMAQYSSSERPSASFIGSTVIQVALSPGCPVMIVNYRPRVCL